MASVYDPIISQLIASNKAEVVVHRDCVRVTIAMVKKVKSQRNPMRKDLGAFPLPGMTYTITQLSDHKSRIVFTLNYPIVF